MFHSITINTRPIKESMIRYIEDCMRSTDIKSWRMKTSTTVDIDGNVSDEAVATMNCGKSKWNELYDKISDVYTYEIDSLMTFK